MSIIKQITILLLFLFIASCSKKEEGYIFKYANEQPESAIRSQSMLFSKNNLRQNQKIKLR